MTDSSAAVVALTNKSFITEEFEEPEGLIRFWIAIDEDGQIVAREHGLFTVNTTRFGEEGLCDSLGRTPGMSMAAEMVQAQMCKGRERQKRGLLAWRRTNLPDTFGR